jgi:hypothetical protein
MRWIALATVVACMGETRAFAQNAQITGVVKDQTGAIIPGATVSATNALTGLARSAVTDDKGEYRLPALPPGNYVVATELQGFGAESRPDIVLVIDQTAIINFTLKPATVAETVTVTGESPIVDTTASDVSTSVSTQQIQDLPVASRRWIDLAMLTPGTSQDNIRGQFYRGNVNIGAGTREYSNGFVVDGVNNTWAEMGEPRQNFAMDAIQEFKVSTSNYKAEYGLATGGLLTVVTKSGTNSLHGSGLLFFRDRAINSETYFEKQNDILRGLPIGTSKPDYRRYQYGGTVGGPIIRNRTHYFFAYERTDEDQFFTVSARGLWPDYEGVYKSEQERWTYNVKVDHQLSNKQSLFFRYGAEDEYRPIITAGGSTAASASFDFAVPRYSAVVGHTWVLNDRTLNEFRFQKAFSKYEVAPPYSHGSWEPGDFEARLPYCTPIFRYPSITLGGCGNAQMGPEDRWQLKDDLSYLTRGMGGTHQWKTGFDISFVPFAGDNTGSPLGSWTFPRDTPYNAADPTTFPTQYTNSLPTYADIPTTTFALYVQDDWEVGRGLTLNMGLRYDRQLGAFNEDVNDLLGRIQDKLGRDGSYPVDITVIQTPENRGDSNNFGPRVGVAWDPTGRGETVIRAGYGMFYDNQRTLQNFGELTWPQAKSIVINNPRFPDPYNGLPRETFFSIGTPNVTIEDNETVNAYAHQFNVGLNRMIGSQFALSADVTFVDRSSDRDTVDVNLPDQVTRVKPYPQFNRVSTWVSTADNTYRALLLKLEKRMNNRYQFLVSYTLSDAKDNNFINTMGDKYGYFKLERYGSADRRHRLVTSGIVRLPWEIQFSAIGDFRSSLPFSPSTNLDLNLDGYTGDLPADILPGSGCRSLNLDAINTFRRSRNLTPVTEVDCPAFANVDLRASKFFQIGRSRLEVIAQLFNMFDRANFAISSGNMQAGNDANGRPLFGQPASLAPNINAPARQGEIAVRIQF